MTNKLISLALLIFFLTIGYGHSEDQFLYPKKKPSVFKKIESTVKSENFHHLPQKKPIIQTDTKKTKIVEVKPIIKKEVKIDKKISVFLLPQKKPITYKVQSKAIEKSTILKQKDFEKAKETIKFVKARKWNSALKSAKKVKDSEFRNLITWMHLKTTQNSASFNEYKNFIDFNKVLIESKSDYTFERFDFNHPIYILYCCRRCCGCYAWRSRPRRCLTSTCDCV